MLSYFFKYSVDQNIFRIIVRFQLFIYIYITIVLKCIINEFNNHTFLNILWIKIYLESL